MLNENELEYAKKYTNNQIIKSRAYYDLFEKLDIKKYKAMSKVVEDMNKEIDSEEEDRDFEEEAFYRDLLYDSEGYAIAWEEINAGVINKEDIVEREYELRVEGV